ncbi:hypothetical protein WJX74_010872 [Apatococcus lobatus]|uniref:Uncharacterized protein n=1 Tax=Apatococcus lobatus TaxID=904363 RepID=A0AAW1Q243_9CHLO
MLGGYQDKQNVENDAQVQGAADFAAEKLGEGKVAKILSLSTNPWEAKKSSFPPQSSSEHVSMTLLSPAHPSRP